MSSTRPKRQRRSYSCGPCKTLKIKCDLNTPCSACLRFKRHDKCIMDPPQPPSAEELSRTQGRKKKIKEESSSTIPPKVVPHGVSSIGSAVSTVPGPGPTIPVQLSHQQFSSMYHIPYSHGIPQHSLPQHSQHTISQHPLSQHSPQYTALVGNYPHPHPPPSSSSSPPPPPPTTNSPYHPSPPVQNGHYMTATQPSHVPSAGPSYYQRFPPSGHSPAGPPPPPLSGPAHAYPPPHPPPPPPPPTIPAGQVPSDHPNHPHPFAASRSFKPSISSTSSSDPTSRSYVGPPGHQSLRGPSSESTPDHTPGPSPLPLPLPSGASPAADPSTGPGPPTTSTTGAATKATATTSTSAAPSTAAATSTSTAVKGSPVGSTDSPSRHSATSDASQISIQTQGHNHLHGHPTSGPNLTSTVDGIVGPSLDGGPMGSYRVPFEKKTAFPPDFANSPPAHPSPPTPITQAHHSHHYHHTPHHGPPYSHPLPAVDPSPVDPPSVESSAPPPPPPQQQPPHPHQHSHQHSSGYMSPSSSETTAGSPGVIYPMNLPEVAILRNCLPRTIDRAARLIDEFIRSQHSLLKGFVEAPRMIAFAGDIYERLNQDDISGLSLSLEEARNLSMLLMIFASGELFCPEDELETEPEARRASAEASGDSRASTASGSIPGVSGVSGVSTASGSVPGVSGASGHFQSVSGGSRGPGDVQRASGPSGSITSISGVSGPSGASGSIPGISGASGHIQTTSGGPRAPGNTQTTSGGSRAPGDTQTTSGGSRAPGDTQTTSGGSRAPGDGQTTSGGSTPSGIIPGASGTSPNDYSNRGGSRLSNHQNSLSTVLETPEEHPIDQATTSTNSTNSTAPTASAAGAGAAGASSVASAASAAFGYSFTPGIRGEGALLSLSTGINASPTPLQPPPPALSQLLNSDHPPIKPLPMNTLELCELRFISSKYISLRILRFDSVNDLVFLTNFFFCVKNYLKYTEQIERHYIEYNQSLSYVLLSEKFIELISERETFPDNKEALRAWMRLRSIQVDYPYFETKGTLFTTPQLRDSALPHRKLVKFAFGDDAEGDSLLAYWLGLWSVYYRRADQSLLVRDVVKSYLELYCDMYSLMGGECRRMERVLGTATGTAGGGSTVRAGGVSGTAGGGSTVGTGAGASGSSSSSSNTSKSSNSPISKALLISLARNQTSLFLFVRWLGFVRVEATYYPSLRFASYLTTMANFWNHFLTVVRIGRTNGYQSSDGTYTPASQFDIIELLSHKVGYTSIHTILRSMTISAVFSACLANFAGKEIHTQSERPLNGFEKMYAPLPEHKKDGTFRPVDLTALFLQTSDDLSRAYDLVNTSPYFNRVLRRLPSMGNPLRLSFQFMQLSKTLYRSSTYHGKMRDFADVLAQALDDASWKNLGEMHFGSTEGTRRYVEKVYDMLNFLAISRDVPVLISNSLKFDQDLMDQYRGQFAGLALTRALIDDYMDDIAGPHLEARDESK
ncbi:hypothetical protein CAAN1_15S03290 [[Candida] anglica]|uniref:Zn(2)-C6 fungal-type domain-containing protein n=1 Tax=[Candida] anglica TaxID=148631 RepID=A0ABP0E856_9ASCO